MKVIVSDTSVIIDLAKVRLIEPAFALPYDFIVPDVMYADEWLDLGSYEREDLLACGLSISVLDSNGVEIAYQYGETYRRLSVYDRFAMALAKTTDDAILLTGDRAMTNAALEQDVDVRGLLWLCDQMNEHETIASGPLRDALVALDEDEFVRLPRAELRKRIARLSL